MANGEMLEEVRRILESPNSVPQSAVNRLILSIMAEVYQTQKENIANEALRHIKIEADIVELQKKSILIWIENNRPIALALCTLILIAVLAAPNILVVITAKMLGVPYP